MGNSCAACLNKGESSDGKSYSYSIVNNLKALKDLQALKRNEEKEISNATNEMSTAGENLLSP
jgi:hypothetical protein